MWDQVLRQVGFRQWIIIWNDFLPLEPGLRSLGTEEFKVEIKLRGVVIRMNFSRVHMTL